MKSRNLLPFLATAKAYRQKPSELLALDDPYTAYCLDEACLYIEALTQELPNEQTLKDADFTKRGLHGRDSVSKLLELYSLEGAIYIPSDSYTYEKWEGKYKDGADLVNQAKDDEDSLYLIRLSFIKDGDNLVPLEIDENGKRKYIGDMTYEIMFSIGGCKVNLITVSSKVQ